MKNKKTLFLATATLLFITNSYLYAYYDVIDLGGGWSCAYSVNDKGQIVGWIDIGNGPRACLFDNTGGGANIDLGALSYIDRCDFSRYSRATSINNNGQIVGFAMMSTDFGDYPPMMSRACLFDPTGGRANIDLGILPDAKYPYSQAWFINDNGQIVGKGRAVTSDGISTNMAILFDPTGGGANINLGTLEGGYTSGAYSINENGQIVGEARLVLFDADFACLFDPTGGGANINLGSFGDSIVKAISINNKGQIVGWTGSFGPRRACLFDPTGSGNNICLGGLGGGEACARCINDNGQIVGYARNSSRSYRACLFDPTGQGNNIDLNTLIDPASSWTLTDAYCINNNGWIVGCGIAPDGGTRAYLLKLPQPQPKTRLVPSQYMTIQAGIDAAVDGDTVLVASRIYTGPGNRDIDFKGKAITVKSESGPESCIIDCNDISDELRRGFSFRSGEGANSILDGFTIENANFYNGAGVYCLRESSPTIINCIIRNNKAGDGAAIFCDSASNPKIINCVITDNTAEDRGGGIYCSHSCPVITNCVISNNTARRHDGGGIFCGCNPTPASILNITNCTINGNSAGDMGGGIYNCGNLTISDSNISGNSSASGGGIWTNNGNQKITRCKITGNKAVFSREPSGLGGGILDFGKKSIIRDSLIVGNAAGLGGGIWCKDYKPTIINCTITENVASGAGGSIYCEGRDIVGVIRNCVLWNEGISENVPEMYLGGSSNFTVSYTDVRGGQSGIYLDIHSTPTLVWGSGNIDSDPCFVNAGYWDPNSTSGNPADDFWVDGDYHLLAGSPCINTGDPNYTVEPNETDLDDNPRVMGGRIDMGAYEFPIFNTAPVACIVDGNQTIEAQGPFGAKVTLDGSCSSDADSTPGTSDDINDFNWYEIDPCNAAVSLSNLPDNDIFLGSGETIDCNLPLGEHTIVLEVTDKAGAADSNEITITIEDTTPPVINCPADITLEATSPTGAVATFIITATDTVDPSPNVTCDPPSGSTFPLGTTQVTCIAADFSGNSSSCTFNVTVVDTTPPNFRLAITPRILWPPNHKMIKITPTCTATDICDPSPQVSLVNVACNEPHSKNDILITESGLIFLRAERSGTSHSRIYTVTYRANDCSGNSTTRSAVVIVPHDFRRRF